MRDRRRGRSWAGDFMWRKASRARENRTDLMKRPGMEQGLSCLDRFCGVHREGTRRSVPRTFDASGQSSHASRLFGPVWPPFPMRTTDRPRLLAMHVPSAYPRLLLLPPSASSPCAVSPSGYQLQVLAIRASTSKFSRYRFPPLSSVDGPLLCPPHSARTLDNPPKGRRQIRTNFW
ncbi:hypothetical protein BKA93DRAFT_61556 [Sparassis latifolia]